MTDIRLIDVDPVTRLVSFRTSSKTLSGIDELIQIVVLSLLNTPGKDVLHPNKGGGISELVRYNMTEANEMFTEVASRVSKTEQEIIEDQVGLNLNPETKLRKINIRYVKQGDTEDTILVGLQIVNERGRIAEVTI